MDYICTQCSGTGRIAEYDASDNLATEVYCFECNGRGYRNHDEVLQSVLRDLRHAQTTLGELKKVLEEGIRKVLKNDRQ